MQTIKIVLTLLVTGSIYYGNSTCGGRAHKHDDLPSSQEATTKDSARMNVVIVILLFGGSFVQSQFEFLNRDS